MGSPGSDPLLHLPGQATICYVVQDEVITSNANWGDVPKLSLQIQDVFREAASHASHGQVVPAACDHQQLALAFPDPTLTLSPCVIHTYQGADKLGESTMKRMLTPLHWALLCHSLFSVSLASFQLFAQGCQRICLCQGHRCCARHV